MRSHFLQRLTWFLLVLAAIPIAVPASSLSVSLRGPSEQSEDSDSSEEDKLDEDSLDEAALLGRQRLRLVNRRVARRECSADWAILQRMLDDQTSQFSADFVLAESAARNGFGGPLRC